MTYLTQRNVDIRAFLQQDGAVPRKTRYDLYAIAVTVLRGQEKSLTNPALGASVGESSWPQAALLRGLHRLARRIVDALCGPQLGFLFAVAAFFFLYANSVHIVFSSDEGAILYGTKQLLKHGNLSAGGPLNEALNTNIIGNTFSSYRSPDELYYRVFPGTSLLFAPFVAAGDTGYYLTGPVFGAIATAAVFFLALRVSRSYAGASAAAAVWIVAPVFTHWGTNYFNNMPVTAIELCAAYFLVSDHLTPRAAATAGALMGLAVFVRPPDALLLLPILCFVVARTRSVAAACAYVAPAAAGVAMIAVTDYWLFGSPSFLPATASLYLPLLGATAHTAQGLGAGPNAATTPGTVERYLLYLTGTQALSELSLSDKLHNWGFHLRYLAGSSFAFPLLIPGVAGFGLAAARRDGRARSMLGLVLIFVLFVVGFYGSQHGNYWGYGQSVVRSSFVRYSLPIYALCAVGVACAWVHLPQLTHGTRMALACRGALALVVAVGLAAGVMVSYDTQHYGFGRSNSYREHGLRIQAFLDASAEEEMAQEGRTLVIGGPNTSKLISVSKYPDAFEWDHVPRSDWDQTILPVIRSALAQRITTIVLLDQQDSEFFAYLQTHFSLRGPRLHPSNHAFLSLEGSIAIVQGEKAR